MKGRIAATTLLAFAAGFLVRGAWIDDPPPPPARPATVRAPEPTRTASPTRRVERAPEAAAVPAEIEAPPAPAANPDAVDAEPAPERPAPPTLVVLGRCIDEAGAPVAGVGVHLFDRSARASTQSDGKFELTDVPLGASGVHVFPDGCGFAARKLLLTLPRDGRVDLGDVVLRRGGQIRGRFVDLEGKPVANARVWLDSAEAGWLVVARTTTDAAGRFVLDHVGDGVHTVSARSPTCTFDGGAQDAWAHPVFADGGEVLLAVRSAHWVRLQCVDETGAQVGLFRGRFTWSALDDPSDGETFEWEGGGWSQGRVPVRPGVVYEVRYECPGWAPVVQRFEGGEEYERRVDVVFRRPRN